MKNHDRRYSRYFDDKAWAVVLGSEKLCSLLRDISASKLKRKDEKTVDVHFRENNRLMFYVGLTRPLVLDFYMNGQFVTPRADNAYIENADWFGSRIATSEIEKWVIPWRKHLECVEVDNPYWNWEGGVQNSLSLRLSRESSRGPIFSIDRESVIGYANQKVKSDIWGEIRARVLRLAAEMQTPHPPSPRSRPAWNQISYQFNLWQPYWQAQRQAI